MNTKVAQVAAYTLGIDLSFIKVESSDTINGANSIVTGGAVGSESLCFAVRKACDTLKARLEPVKKQGASWVETVAAAYAKSISLIASDLYKQGDMQNYHVYGLALTEIELDVLTGNSQIKFFCIFSIHVIRFACLLLLLWCLTKIKTRLASFSVLNSHLMTSEIIRISNRSVSAVAFSNYIILVTLKLNSICFEWS